MREIYPVSYALCANQLAAHHQRRLQRKFPPAIIEKILETGAEELHGHDVVLALGAVPEYVGDPYEHSRGTGRTFAADVLHELGLVEQLGVGCLHGFLRDRVIC